MTAHRQQPEDNFGQLVFLGFGLVLVAVLAGGRITELEARVSALEERCATTSPRQQHDSDPGMPGTGLQGDTASAMFAEGYMVSRQGVEPRTRRLRVCCARGLQGHRWGVEPRFPSVSSHSSPSGSAGFRECRTTAARQRTGFCAWRQSR